MYLSGNIFEGVSVLTFFQRQWGRRNGFGMDDAADAYLETLKDFYGNHQVLNSMPHDWYEKII
jgi:hypothetical protein